MTPTRRAQRGAPTVMSLPRVGTAVRVEAPTLQGRAEVARRRAEVARDRAGTAVPVGAPLAHPPVAARIMRRGALAGGEAVAVAVAVTPPPRTTATSR